jgi:mannan endo-1,6-alpha-mannosidase
VWKNRTQSLLDRSITFFTDEANSGILVEVACETQAPPNYCNVDMRSFKAYLTRWMAATTKMAPFTYPQISEYLLKNAKAAAAQCTGGPLGRACGLKWINAGKTGVWDGTTGVGEQMSALEVIQSTLIDRTPGPVTNDTGGTSPGDYEAGSGSARGPGDMLVGWEPSGKDRAGAGILTAVVLLTLVGGCGWISMSE